MHVSQLLIYFQILETIFENEYFIIIPVNHSTLVVYKAMTMTMPMNPRSLMQMSAVAVSAAVPADKLSTIGLPRSLVEYVKGIRRCCSDHSSFLAAENGHLECLIQAHENGCIMDKFITREAAVNGHLDCLVYAHENGCELEKFVTIMAAENGHLDCLVYAHENGCVMDKFVAGAAAARGHLDCLKYAHKNGCAMDKFVEGEAAMAGYLACLVYVHENGRGLHF